MLGFMLLPVILRAGVPEFLNQDLLSRPDRVMLLQARNVGIDDGNFFTRMSRELPFTLKSIKRFDMLDQSDILLSPEDVLDTLRAYMLSNEAPADYEAGLVLDPVQIRSLDYILIPECGNYSTNMSIRKYINKEVITNSKGEIQELEHHMVDIESSISFTVSTLVLSVAQARKVETISTRISSREVMSYEIAASEYTGTILLDILNAIIMESRVNKKKEKAAYLPVNNQDKALEALSDEWKDNLNASRTFHKATRIIYKKDKKVYFNQGELWEIQYGDFYSVKQKNWNRTLMQVDSVGELYSRAETIWGHPLSNEVTVQRKVSGMSLQLSMNLVGARIDPLYQTNILARLAGLPDPQISLQDIQIQAFSWKMGYDQIKHLYLLTDVSLHFGTDLNYLSLGLNGGYKFQKGRLALGLGAGICYQNFSSSFEIPRSLASSLGMSTDPAGADRVNVRNSLGVLSLKPEAELRLYISPHLALRVHGGYHLFLNRNDLNISAYQMVPDPESTDESLESQNIFRTTLPNRYLYPGAWYLDYGIVFVF